MNRVAKCRVFTRILCFVLPCLCLMGCGNNKDTSDENTVLRRRAMEFGDLLIRIQNMSELEAKQGLEEFIEPSPTRADRIAQYYSEFSAGSEKFKIVSQSVEKITISSDQKNAEITYRTIARLPEGTELPVMQVTQWKHVDGKWYRIVSESKKRIDH